VDYFSAHQAELDEDSRRRLAGNPLRILDSKNPAMQALIGAAPLLTEHLDEASREQFASLCTTLEALGIPYIINPRLCVASITIRARYSNGSPTLWAPRTPCAPAVAYDG